MHRSSKLAWLPRGLREASRPRGRLSRGCMRVGVPLDCGTTSHVVSFSDARGARSHDCEPAFRTSGHRPTCRGQGANAPPPHTHKAAQLRAFDDPCAMYSSAFENKFENEIRCHRMSISPLCRGRMFIIYEHQGARPSTLLSTTKSSLYDLPAKQAGVTVSAFSISYFNSSQDAKAQAADFLFRTAYGYMYAVRG